MLLLAVFSHRVFRPVCGILQSFISGRGTWQERLNYAIFPVAVGGPTALAAVAGLGYFYTAEQLAARLQATAWLLVGLLIAGALALRWVLVSRRRLAVQQARHAAPRPSPPPRPRSRTMRRRCPPRPTTRSI